VLVGNEARDFCALLGVWLAGGVVVPVYRGTPAAVREATRAATGARFLAGADDAALRRVAGDAPPHRPLLRGAALIVFTSGSTGRPKGVILGHRALLGKLEAIDSLLHFSAATRSLLVLKTTFIFGLWVSLLTLLRGGRVLPQTRFDALETLRTAEVQCATDAAFVPTMLRAILRLDHELSTRIAAQCGLRRILTGGELLDVTLVRRIGEIFPKTGIADIYGSTETCSSDFFLLPEEQARSAGTIGRPAPEVHFRIVDRNGREAAVNEIGELQICSPFVMNGYLDDPALTRAAFSGNFFRTGDLARQRDDGMVELVGRSKDLIVRGGAKLSPVEIDQLLVQHPAVAEALTVGVPDEVLGERVHVLVVARDGYSVDESTLRAWVAGRIEGFKRPDVYHIGSMLPVGATGKVDRAVLRRWIMESIGSRGVCTPGRAETSDDLKN
jgi:acyl-CoA synthetase (AMP-forming)/AMP-acid ligase II